MLKTNNPPVILGGILSGEYMKNTMLNNRSFVYYPLRAIHSRQMPLHNQRPRAGAKNLPNMAQKMLSIGVKSFPLDSLQRGLFTSKVTEKAAILPKSGHLGGKNYGF